IFNSTTNPQALYHDHIHLNLQGNKFVSEVMERSLLEILGDASLAH
ncbi:MAG: SGNH/GDSL hydrolase family protein, partial [Nostoc sp.]